MFSSHLMFCMSSDCSMCCQLGGRLAGVLHKLGGSLIRAHLGPVCYTENAPNASALCGVRCLAFTDNV